MQDTIRSYKKKLAEITSGTGGETTGVKDADALENILTKSDADENIEIAIQHLDAEIEGKPIDELIDLYVAKHQAIANNRSKIDAFKSSVPAYMHTLGEKIFDNIRNTPDTGETGNFPLEMKRGKLFELAQVARDESSRVNIDNHFIDYDLSEEIFQELATGKGGFMDKLDESKTIKPEHKESKDLSIEQRKTLLRSFPGGKVLVEGENGKSGADWITKDYKDLSINERGLLATYVNYQNRFGTIDQAKLTDTDYVELVSSQLNEMIQKTSAFMMDDYERKMDNRMKQLGYNDSRSPLIFQGLSGLDADIAKAYIDMKGFGYLNTSDRNTQKLKEYTAMAAVLVAAIVATVATAGAGGAALAGAIASVAGMASATAAMTTVSTVVV
ncbi:MAG: hypothetical protein LBU27_02060 [Candidatus Peribacteria bacterium]|jgi:hypothetical protein|nr:hypothetical protein [Candidatus Peribacteria bacterium]